MSRHPHVYVPGPWEDRVVLVESEKQKHLDKVLRLASGTALTYTDGAGNLGVGFYEAGRIERGEETFQERPPGLTLAVSPPKAVDRQRFIVEKTAELAVEHLVWINPTRAVGRPPKAAKSATWAQAALEQSLGAWLMEISLADLSELPQAVLADRDGEAWTAATPPPSGPIAIGPEGGWTDEEKAGRRLFSLGDRVLRVETAALVAAAFHHKR